MTAAQYDTAVYNQAVSMGMPSAVAQNIVGQARHESGNYTSDVFRNSNNAFGYKFFAGAKWQKGGNYKGYATYSSIQNSTAEVVDWLKRRQSEGKLTITALSSPEAYATALKKNSYFEDALSNYINGMKAALARVDWQTIGVVAGGSALTLLLVAAAIYFFFKK